MAKKKAAERQMPSDPTLSARDNEKVRKAVARRDRTESRLIRAFNAWVEARAQERRLFTRLDRQTIGGKFDVRELAKGTK